VRRRRLAPLGLSLALGLLAACDSPEASRARGTGPGGDVGNRGRVELHAGSDMYHGTPVVVSAPKTATAPAK
jgi:hypothetical protein